MAYIGQNLNRFSIVEKLDVITPATATGAGPYNLLKGSVAFVPSSADTMVVSIDGVIQYGNFSVSGSTITFDAALSDSNTTNDMLTHHPDAYLYGALVEAEPYLQNDKRIQTWSGFYDRAKQDIITSNERDRHSGTAPVTRIDYGLY